MTINQQLLNTYFSETWRTRNRGLEEFQYTGYALLDKLKQGEQVLDVGCGMNLFKGHWPNVIGIDPAFPEADYQITLEDYVTQNPNAKYDVAFCLGSINFGLFDDIYNQIGVLVRVLKPQARIYWRCNPGLTDHGNQECNSVPFFDWSFYHHAKLAELFGFRVKEIRWDNNNRIYAEWICK
jgi:ubiquinone/menaquinone biosynthesis C-methylase UbiE